MTTRRYFKHRGLLASLLIASVVSASQAQAPPVAGGELVVDGSERAKSPSPKEGTKESVEPATDTSFERDFVSSSENVNESEGPQEDSDKHFVPVAVEQARPLSAVACLELHEQAQLLRLDGRLLKSEEYLEKCTTSSCPEVLRNDCAGWLEEVQGGIPRVSFFLKGDSGELQLVGLFVNGERENLTLEGHILRLDPGTYEIRVEVESGDSRQARVVLSEGDEFRVVEFDFRSPVPAPELVPRLETAPREAHEFVEAGPSLVASRPLLVPAQVLTGVSLLSLGVGIGFGIDAISEQNAAEDACSPVCDPAVSERVSRSATISDVAFGTALVAAVGAAALYFFGPVVYIPENEQSRAGSPSFALSLDKQGGSFTAGARF